MISDRGDWVLYSRPQLADTAIRYTPGIRSPQSLTHYISNFGILLRNNKNSVMVDNSPWRNHLLCCSVSRLAHNENYKYLMEDIAFRGGFWKAVLFLWNETLFSSVLTWEVLRITSQDGGSSGDSARGLHPEWNDRLGEGVAYYWWVKMADAGSKFCRRFNLLSFAKFSQVKKGVCTRSSSYWKVIFCFLRAWLLYESLPWIQFTGSNGEKLLRELDSLSFIRETEIGALILIN